MKALIQCIVMMMRCEIPSFAQLFYQHCRLRIV